MQDAMKIAKVFVEYSKEIKTIKYNIIASKIIGVEPKIKDERMDILWEGFNQSNPTYTEDILLGDHAITKKEEISTTIQHSVRIPI